MSAQPRLHQSGLLGLGWCSLLVSLLIPLFVSAGHYMEQRSPYCQIGSTLSAVPLLYSCGEPSDQRLVIGWIGAIVTVVLFVVAVVSAALALWNVRSARRLSPSLWSTFAFAMTTLAVMAVIALMVLAVDGVRTASWIIYASFLGTVVYVVGGIAGVVVSARATNLAAQTLPEQRT
ncbi:MAG: hypothetical protein IE935_02320 [Micrococcales bacterium]|nr:hypothetical protein [Micrococcales bacterium]